MVAIYRYVLWLFLSHASPHMLYIIYNGLMDNITERAIKKLTYIEI